MSIQKYPQASSTSADGTKTTRKGREFYSHAKADARKDKRRDEAEARQAKYDSFTLKEKIASCVPGGSKRQMAKLQAKLAKEPVAVKVPASSPTPLVDAYKAEKAKRTPKAKVVRKYRKPFPDLVGEGDRKDN